METEENRGIERDRKGKKEIQKEKEKNRKKNATPYATRRLFNQWK